MNMEYKYYKYLIGTEVVLKRKKANGYPRGRKVGDKLMVLDIMYSVKCVRLVIKGNRGVSDKFSLHESYIEGIAERREKFIDELFMEI